MGRAVVSTLGTLVYSATRGGIQRYGQFGEPADWECAVSPGLVRGIRWPFRERGADAGRAGQQLGLLDDQFFARHSSSPEPFNLP